MKSLESIFGAGAISLEGARRELLVPRPASIRGMLRVNDQPVVLSEPLTTGDGIALGGEHTVTLRPDGSMSYTGRLRATGWPSYDVAVSTRIIGAGGIVVTLAAHASVHGTNEAGDRETSWAIQVEPSPLLSRYWLAFRQARLEHDLQYDADLFGTVGAVAAFVGKAVAAAYTGGTAGVVLLLGAEAADAAGMQELALPGLVGVAIAGGTLVILGKGAVLPAMLAGAAGAAVTAAMVHQRRLTDAEFAFADRVFRGTLPRERIVLTNLLGLGGRPFTVPVPGNAILVNLGDGYDDPIHYTGDGQGEVNVEAAGQLLIHELCHAWQIEHSPFLPWTLCKGVGNQLGTLSGNMSVYSYGDAGPVWSAFNLEQQASIVDQWFAGNEGPKGRQSRFRPQLESNDEEPNPYWRYVRDNVRAGVT